VYFSAYLLPVLLLAGVSDFLHIWIIQIIVDFWASLLCPFLQFLVCIVYIGHERTDIIESRFMVSYHICLFLMCCGAIFYMSLVIAIDTRRARGESSSSSEPALESMEEEDDVLAERIRIKDAVSAPTEAADPIIVNKLCKSYPKGKHAVQSLTFGVPYGEVFGLLGPNGAGKSSTFYMMTGKLKPTSGEIQLIGRELLKHQIYRVGVRAGLCPQNNPLWDDLTVEEHLKIYALMKGVDGNDIPGQLEYIIDSLNLKDYRLTRATALSGGNKRKLCAGICLIGGPALQFFDEPSSGMDPMARRHLWRTINDAQKAYKPAIIFSTHSMSEAENLCQRIAIMVNGKFVCLGSVQHLKHKYARGYQVTLKKGQDHDDEAITGVVMESFPKATKLPSNSRNYMAFRLAPEDSTLSRLFDVLNEKLKGCGKVEDFSVQQCSLEQIFMYFSQMQEEPELNVQPDN
jgi:ATP-binding cassette subfamily A (ABC1) protein 3